MEKNNTNYVAPEIQVIDVQSESVLCSSKTYEFSSPGFGGFGSEDRW